LAFALLALWTAGCGGGDRDGTPVPPVSGPEILVDPSVEYQVISGWEATTQAGQLDAAFPAFRDSLLSLAVNDLGINRLRLEVRSGSEHTRDWYADFRAGRIDMDTWRCNRYAPVNDDADPRHLNGAGFQFGEMDEKVEQIVLPMRDLLSARSERLHLNVTFVAFSRQACTPSLLVHDNPEEYAEFVLATVQHLDSAYGLVPDTWEVILEPDNTDFWRGKQIGDAIVAAARRLEQHGYDQIRFVAPSNTNMSRAVDYFDDLATVPGAVDRVAELSYHRYGGVSQGVLRDIADRAQSHGISTAMLEHIGSGYEDLHEDLAIANASAWQQFALAFPTGDDNGAQYYLIDKSDPASPRILPGSRTPYLRQYFRYIRRGARRIGAASRVRSLAPLAFVDSNGTTVVVVKSTGLAEFAVGGLPAGRYRVSHTTSAGFEETGVVSVTSSGIAHLTIPGAGVLTLAGEPQLSGRR
jgi:hypothetical protein